MNSNRFSYVLESLNSFHSNIEFTAEVEKGNKIAFLEILIRYKDLISATIYHKKTNLIYTSTGNLFLQTIGNRKHLTPKFQGGMIYVQLKNTL